jgi:hypothetical protein
MVTGLLDSVKGNECFDQLKNCQLLKKNSAPLKQIEKFA